MLSFILSSECINSPFRPIGKSFNLLEDFGGSKIISGRLSQSKSSSFSDVLLSLISRLNAFRNSFFFHLQFLKLQYYFLLHNSLYHKEQKQVY